MQNEEEHAHRIAVVMLESSCFSTLNEPPLVALGAFESRLRAGSLKLFMER